MKPKANPQWKNDTRSNNLDPLNEWDRYVGMAQKERDSWKLACYILIGIVFVTIPGWIYVGSLPSQVPHVIEIAGWGEARYRGPVGQSASSIVRSDTSIRYYLRQFIMNIRSISSDKLIIQSRLTTAFRYVTTTGFGILQNLVRADDPFVRANRIRTEIDIESLLLLNEQTYQIDWLESDYLLATGERDEQRRYRGVFTLAFIDPDDEQIISNPLGIFVDTFEIQEIRI